MIPFSFYNLLTDIHDLKCNGVQYLQNYKCISITKDVYDKLMKIKRENESFSELFL